MDENIKVLSPHRSQFHKEILVNLNLSRTSVVEVELTFKSIFWGASLVVQWLRIRLPMQGTQVRALVQEDPTCRGATKPMHHNY